MNDINPYGSTASPVPDGIAHVKVRPIQLLGRSMQLMGDQYILFVAICFVGGLLGAIVPFNLLMGAMLIGIYMCFREREQGRLVEFGILFRGFDQFFDSFLVILAMTAVMILVYIPFFLTFFLIVLWPLMQNPSSDAPAEVPMWFGILSLIVPIILGVASMLFLFTFQLIADRGNKAMDAISKSVAGVMRNFWGVLWFCFLMTTLMSLGALMCVVPFFFAFPVIIGASFVLYRDIYGPSSLPV